MCNSNLNAMKKIFLSILIILVSQGIIAADKSINNNNIEIMLGLDIGSEDIVSFGASTVYTTYLNDIFQLGGGFGYSNIKYTMAVPSSIKENTYSLFTDFRAIYPIGEKASLVGVINGGVILTEPKLRTKDIGAIISPQAGFSFRLSKMSKFSLNTRIKYQYITNLGINSVGIMFGVSL